MTRRNVLPSHCSPCKGVTEHQYWGTDSRGNKNTNFCIYRAVTIVFRFTYPNYWSSDQRCSQNRPLQLLSKWCKVVDYQVYSFLITIHTRSIPETMAGNGGQRKEVYGIIACFGKKRRICDSSHPELVEITFIEGAPVMGSYYPTV